jgi:hypothetical protein
MYQPTRELLAAPAPANEQIVSDRDLGYITSSEGKRDIALPLSDRDRPDYCAAALDSAVVFLPDSSKALFWTGSSKNDLLAFPEAVIDEIGTALGVA